MNTVRLHACVASSCQAFFLSFIPVFASKQCYKTCSAYSSVLLDLLDMVCVCVCERACVHACVCSTLATCSMRKHRHAFLSPMLLSLHNSAARQELTYFEENTIHTNSTCTNVYTWACTQTHKYANMQACTHTHNHTQSCTHKYTQSWSLWTLWTNSTYTHTHTCKHMLTHTHTFWHAYIQESLLRCRTDLHLRLRLLPRQTWDSTTFGLRLFASLKVRFGLLRQGWTEKQKIAGS